MPRGTHYFLPGMWNKVVRDITINDITDAYTALNNRSFFFRSISFSSLVFRSFDREPRNDVARSQ